ncbi:MAG: hypothetical protein HY423_15820 [Candidatus Lambdaproteobacteria bacterium]|nr:hypothetical protein [Candidatus Lambdaproteobacteria bacterium]
MVRLRVPTWHAWVRRAVPATLALIAALVAAFALALTRGPAAGAAELAPVQKLSYYPGALERPIEEKISLGTPELIDRQHAINKKYGQDVRPHPARPDHPLIPKVREMLAELPPAIRALASRYVVALYLVEGDYGTGTTEAVQDDQGRWRYTYVALNLSVLDRTANAWGTWKERSAFRSDPRHGISMVLEAPGEDTVTAALRFIFVHELGHVLGLGLGAHGWWDAPELPAATREAPFVRLSWQPDGKGDLMAPARARFPRLARLDFYAFEQARLPLAEAEAAYRELAQTDFPSLYGATNYFDDFAESFAIYVHTRMLGRPYRVEVRQAGETRFVFRSCIESGACAAKVEAVERVLGLR